MKPRGGSPYGLLYPIFKLPELLLLLLFLLELPLVLEHSHGVFIIGACIRPALHGVSELPQRVIWKAPGVSGAFNPSAVSPINLSDEFI